MRWGIPRTRRTSPGASGGCWRCAGGGIVHLTNAGVCSRLDLAQAALEEAGLDQTEVRGIASSEWPSPTRRPLHAVLESARSRGSASRHCGTGVRRWPSTVLVLHPAVAGAGDALGSSPWRASLLARPGSSGRGELPFLARVVQEGRASLLARVVQEGRACFARLRRPGGASLLARLSFKEGRASLARPSFTTDEPEEAAAIPGT